MKLKKEKSKRNKQSIQLNLIDWINQKETEEIIKIHVWFDYKGEKND